MRLLDDIKNIQPLSNEVITKEKLIKNLNDIFKDVKREHKLLQTLKHTGTTKVNKQVDYLGLFDLGNGVDKTDTKIITPFGTINIK